MSYECISYEQSKRIVKVILDRPEKLNALNSRMYAELNDALDRAENSKEFRVLIITGSGRAFCSGGDLSELENAVGSVEASQARLRMSHGIALRLKQLKQPIIVAVNGDAFGGGCTLALVGDLRVCSDKARFCLSFIKVGLVPDMGGIYNLPRLVGIGKACELSFFGNVIDAVEAERIGLVNKVVPEDEVDKVVSGWAKKLSESSETAIVLMKQALHKSLNMDFVAELEDEINIQTVCMNSSRAQEGIRAFLNKTK